MTEQQAIEQAKQYAIAIGRDPELIETVEDAQRLFGGIAYDCAKYGSD